jgi:hypothetical protein
MMRTCKNPACKRDFSTSKNTKMDNQFCTNACYHLVHGSPLAPGGLEKPQREPMFTELEIAHFHDDDPITSEYSDEARKLWLWTVLVATERQTEDVVAFHARRAELTKMQSDITYLADELKALQATLDAKREEQDAHFATILQNLGV